MSFLEIALSIYLGSAIWLYLIWEKYYNDDPDHFQHPVFNYKALGDIMVLVPILNTIVLLQIGYSTLKSKLKRLFIYRTLNKIARKNGYPNFKVWSEALKKEDPNEVTSM